MLLDLIEKTKQTYVLLVLAKCVYVITSFYLKIYKKAHDVLALVVDFLGENSKPKHVIIDFFEAFQTLGQALARILLNLLKQHGLTKKILALC
jgi:hypothetical protein